LVNQTFPHEARTPAGTVDVAHARLLWFSILNQPCGG